MEPLSYCFLIVPLFCFCGRRPKKKKKKKIANVIILQYSDTIPTVSDGKGQGSSWPEAFGMAQVQCWVGVKRNWVLARHPDPDHMGSKHNLYLYLLL